MTTTYTYDGTLKVIITDGKVTHSDFQHCIVGQKPDKKALKSCGWRLVRKPRMY